MSHIYNKAGDALLMSLKHYAIVI